MKRLLVLLALLTLVAAPALAQSFSAVAPTGQTLYYEINGCGTVAVTYPGNYTWDGYTQPSGALTIPSSVVYNGMDYTVTTIGGYAFRGCRSLASVTIPNSVTFIEKGAFKGCRSLATVTIPSSVTTIGDSAFEGCRSLASVTIPNSVTIIGYMAFSGCSSLVSVTIPNSVTSIGDGAFSGVGNIVYSGRATGSPWSARVVNGYVEGSLVYTNSARTNLVWCASSVTTVTIPGSVTTIGGNAFEDCRSLATVTIPNSVTTIGYRAFSGCGSLATVTIPNSVISIGGSAFSGVGNVVYSGQATGSPWGAAVRNGNVEGGLIYADSARTNLVWCASSVTSVTIPNTVTTIGGYAFRYCDSLVSVTIPNSVTTIGGGAFWGCSSLVSVTIPDSVTTIGGYTFYDCSSLSTVTIPNSVTDIGWYAFQGCSSLSTVTIPISVIAIGDFAFSGCSSLSTVTIPGSVFAIGGSVFRGCSSLSTVTIPNSVTTIGGSAFSGCSSLATVTIPNSVVAIGDCAFCGCSSLATVTIPRFVTSIGHRTFDGCSSLSTVTIPSSVTTIGDYAFRGCRSLATVTIPSSVATIGGGAFSEVGNVVYSGQATGSPWDAAIVNGWVDGDLVYTSSARTLVWCAPSVTTVTIPGSVTTIGGHAFDGCSSLATVTIPGSVTSIGWGAFSGCSSLATVTIPDSVTSIGDFAFSGCSSLSTVTIPGSLTAIGWKTFYGCRSLSTVTIPSSVTTIGGHAFEGCCGLDSIVSRNANAPAVADSSVFLGVSSTIPVYILCGSRQSYTTNWGTYFTNFVETVPALTVVSADTAVGEVEVLNVPSDCSDLSATVQALADSGYHFDHWSNGSTQNPYTLVLTSDTSLIAYFASDSSMAVTQVEGGDVTITVDRADVTVRGAAQQTIRVYDVRGRLLASEAKAAEAQTFRMPASGTYIVQVADRPAEKVVVVR